ncbi:hypothetical protein Scep_001059 [Stephania cephalantha]|uniref:Uncharacterized protein n=1 Tax=Stephania cephalantha TaxID=152367 RepID=A0AAP0L797_9MAGN
MAWRSGSSISRSLLSAARAPSLRSSATAAAPRLRPPPLSAPRLQSSRRYFFANPRTIGELGCAQSLLPLHSVFAAARLTSHLAVDARACCELSQVYRKHSTVLGTNELHDLNQTDRKIKKYAISYTILDT